MPFRDLLKWNTRVSAVYAVGIWTMVGSYALVRFSRRHEEPPVKKEEEFQEPEDPNQVVHLTAHSKTVIVYRKDFVPYSTRIYNFLRSFSGGPERGDGDK
ncbi:small integral membrane protein 26-like [Anoplopoma fimbria]|uniref:small integral membrane protein 26-like n=1 Tax=Anoplopoma fimbria TaxID=229290 RepID=UPI0023ECA254|nr:small integral membrane protein 26-like [Anoplopoma fimbria]XP_054461266.1 small integral membrane protein 26-like [Anoplopoma fimbria]